MISHEDARHRLREHVYSKWENLPDAAAYLGCSLGHLTMILSGKRTIPDWLLSEVGMIKRRVWLYYEADETPVLPCGAQVYCHHDRPRGRT